MTNITWLLETKNCSFVTFLWWVEWGCTNDLYTLIAESVNPQENYAIGKFWIHKLFVNFSDIIKCPDLNPCKCRVWDSLFEQSYNFCKYAWRLGFIKLDLQKRLWSTIHTKMVSGQVFVMWLSCIEKSASFHIFTCHKKLYSKSSWSKQHKVIWQNSLLYS